MHVCKGFCWLLAAVIGVFGGLRLAGADEPLAVKVEMRHGANGPKRTPEIFPGERMYFAISLAGLTQNEEKRFKVKIKSDLRDENDELLASLPSATFETKPNLGKDRCVALANFGSPLESAGKTLYLVVEARDVNSGKQTTCKFPVKARSVDGPYPVQVEYLFDIEKRISAPGRLTTGDNAYISLFAAGIEKTKKLVATAEFFRNGEATPISVERVEAEISAANREQKGMWGCFQLSAMEPFTGFVRITVTDADTKLGNSVDLPLVVAEALEMSSPAFLAERPEPESEPTKKK